MELHFYNTNEKDLSEEKHPIFIGISVGIKPMSHDTVLAYVKWANEHSSDTVQILIADEIARYNYLVFSHSTKPGALARAIRDGDKYEEYFENILSSNKLQSRFKILRWKDICGEEYAKTLKQVKKEFSYNIHFREEIFSILNMYIARRGKEVSYDRKLILCQYLLEELPTLLEGVYINGKHYSLILYPTYRQAGMSELVSSIQNKKKYIELGNRLSLKKIIMVEAIINENTDQGMGLGDLR